MTEKTGTTTTAVLPGPPEPAKTGIATATENAATLHPKVTGAVIGGIVAKYSVKVLEAKTSIDFGEDAISDFTILLVAVGGWIVPSKLWARYRA